MAGSETSNFIVALQNTFSALEQNLLRSNNRKSKTDTLQITAGSRYEASTSVSKQRQ
jgi:hypothetical protein